MVLISTSLSSYSFFQLVKYWLVHISKITGTIIIRLNNIIRFLVQAGPLIELNLVCHYCRKDIVQHYTTLKKCHDIVDEEVCKGEVILIFCNVVYHNLNNRNLVGFICPINCTLIIKAYVIGNLTKLIDSEAFYRSLSKDNDGCIRTQKIPAIFFRE